MRLVSCSVRAVSLSSVVPAAHSRQRFLRSLFAAAALLCLAASASANTYTVTALTDSNPSGGGVSGDLRWAITQADADGQTDTINFQAGLSGTITLGASLPAITGNLTLSGPGASKLKISGNDLYQVFQISSGAVSISGLTVSHGTSGNTGGGLNATGGTVSIMDCVFSYNTARNQGGAIYSQTFMTITGSEFAENSGYSTVSSGGAIFSSNSSANALVVSDSTFWKNKVLNIYQLEGGAIYAAAGTVTGSTFVQNWAPFGGAMFVLNVNVTNSTFVQNSASGGGGAIYIPNTGISTITNNTFYGNSADGGGAVDTDGPSVAMNNNVFALNSAVHYGGAIYGFSAHGSNNVYWGNTDWISEPECFDCATSTNEIEASSNPLMSLSSFGGPTQTMMLTPASAAICAGSAALAVDANNNALTSDQRGFPFNYGYCSTSGMVDAGAVQSNFLTVNTTADTDDGSCTSTVCSLRDAIAVANASTGDIAFSSALNNQTIGLGSGLEISGEVSIIGPGANLLTVARSGGASTYSDFTVDATAQAVLYGLTIANGSAASNGGGINNAGTLLVSSSVLSGDGSNNFGGAIYNTGTLNVVGSTLTNGQAKYGGGLFNDGGSASLVETTISGNTGGLYGGGVYNHAGSVSSANTTIVGNFAPVAGAGIYEFAGTTWLANSLITGNRLGNSSIPGNYDDIDAGVGAAQVDQGGNVIGYNGTSDPAAPASAATVGALGYSGSSALPTMLPLPQSPAICGGLATNLAFPVIADERGFPNNNTSYGGFSSSNPCVDAGAAQTNYTSVAFVQQPTNTTVNTLISPSPSVKLVETNAFTSTTDIPAIAQPITLTYSGGSGEMGGTLTQTTSAGVATYGDLTPNTTGSGFTLATSVPVTTAGSGTTLNTTSSAFYVVGAFAGYTVSAPATALDGAAFNFTVQAVDANGNQILTPTDQVTFSSTDASAVLPGTSSLSGGAGTFSATLNTSGPQTITVTDAVNPSITATSGTIAASGPATQLVVSGYPSPVPQGVVASGTVSALDAFGFTATTFNGPVIVTTSDTQAFVSSNVTLVNGTGTFKVAFFTAGTQSISAAYSGLSSTPETGIIVNPIPSYVVTSTADDASGVAGNCPVPSTGNTCTLRDAVAAATASGGGSITFDPAVFPATIHLTHGAMTLPNQTVITGTSSPVTLDGSGNGTSIFSIASGSFASLSNLNLTNAPNFAIHTNGSLAVSNCGFLNNVGGIQNPFGSLSVNQSTFSGSSNNPGISTSSGTLSVTNSVFTHNVNNGGGGGAIASISSQLSISGGTFSQNSGARGGAISMSGDNRLSVTISNSTFTGNSSGEGGAIYSVLRGGDVTNLSIYSSTIAGNTSSGPGGGIYSIATLKLYGSIVAGNSAATSFADVDPAAGTYTDEGGNVAGTSASGTSTIDPMLSALGNYGGLTQTMVPLPASPAVCNSTTAAMEPEVSTDQRGVGLNAGGYCAAGNIDSGAVQTDYSIAFTTPPVSPVTTGSPMVPAPVVELLENARLVTADVTSPNNIVTISDSANELLGPFSTNVASLTSGAATFNSLVLATDQTNDTLTATLPLTSTITLTTTALVSSQSIVAPNFIWNPAGTIIYGDSGLTDVLNAAVNCTSCGTISYLAALLGGPANPITDTSTLTPGAYVIRATFTPTSSSYLENHIQVPLTISSQSVWIGNSGGGVSELAGNGYAISPSAYPGANSGVAIDAFGNVWTVGTDTTLLEGINQVGSSFTSVTESGGSDAYSAIAVDGNSQLWITNSGNNNVNLYSDNGTSASLAGTFTDGSLNLPSGIAVDVGGSVWVANKGNNTVTRILGAAAPVSPLSTAAANKTTGVKP